MNIINFMSDNQGRRFKIPKILLRNARPVTRNRLQERRGGCLGFSGEKALQRDQIIGRYLCEKPGGLASRKPYSGLFPRKIREKTTYLPIGRIVDRRWLYDPRWTNENETSDEVGSVHRNMQCGSGSHRNAADDRGPKAIRLYEGDDIGCERPNREHLRVAGFGSAMATCFNGYSTEAQVAREGFGRLPRVATQAVLKDYRHSSAPRVIHIEDRRSWPGKLRYRSWS
ncbi:MAG TPA: hypothetical protein VIS99_03160 [Terrimicrobiaceae bacterium]